MKQVQHYTVSSLVSAGLAAAGGADKLVATVILGVNNNGIAIRADVTNLVNKRDAHRAGVLKLRERQAEHTALVKSGYAFIMLAAALFKGKLGAKHGPGWIEAGWERSRKSPRKASQMVPHLQSLHIFMTAKPEFEVPQFNMTAAEADVQFNKVSDAVVALNEQKTLVATLLAAREEAEKKMKTRLSGLFRELRVLLTPVDARWKTFGFNPPGAPETPEVPTNVLAVLIGANAVSVKWTAAARAENYRVSYRVIGVNAEFLSAGLPADVDFTLESLPANSQVEIGVSAMNSGGESAMSEIAKVTTA